MSCRASWACRVTNLPRQWCSPRVNSRLSCVPPQTTAVSCCKNCSALSFTKIWPASSKPNARRRIGGAARDQLAHAVTALVTSAGSDADLAHRFSEIESPIELNLAIKSLVKELLAVAKRDLATRAESEASLRRARHAESAAREVDARCQRRTRLLARKSALAEASATYQLAGTQLEMLQAISTAAPTYEGLVAANQHLEAARADLAAGQERVRDRQGNEALGKPPTSVAKELAGSADKLDHLVAIEAQLDPLERKFSTLEASCTGLDQSIATLTADIEVLPEEIVKVSHGRDQAREFANSVPHLQAEHARASQRLAGALAVDDLSEKLAVAGTQVSQLHTQSTQLADRIHQLRQQRTDGIAGELALTLTVGEPCTVCGSTTHPHPARPTSAHASVEAIELAEVELAATTERLAAASSTHAELDKRLSGTTVAASGQSVESSQLAVKDLASQLDNAQSLAARLPAVDALITALSTQLETAQRELQERLVERAAAGKELDALSKALTADQASTARARAEYPSVRARVAELRECAVQIEELAKASDAFGEAERAVAKRERELSKILSKIGIANRATLIELLPGLAAIDNLRATIKASEHEQAAVADGLSAEDIVSLVGFDVPDVAQLARRTAEAEQQFELAATAATRSAHQLASSKEQAALVAQAGTAVEAVFEQTAATIRIADVVTANSPDNLHKIPLPTYVLMARFKDVVSAANLRLTAMSDGRYQLVHTHEKESRGRRSGLGLVVRDFRTEQSRAPGDLSGGESFYTALSLALGLADVVTAEAGGVELGTLFIDEGFGSLDSETLDSVLAEISRLRDGGRVVGVVSHVDELKQRIPDRIEVRRLPGGASNIRQT